MEMFLQFVYGSDSPILILNAKRLCTVLNDANYLKTQSSKHFEHWIWNFQWLSWNERSKQREVRKIVKNVFEHFRNNEFDFELHRSN